MKANTLIVSLFLVAIVGFADGANFDQIKSLAGNWQAKTPEGQDVTATFEVVSGGTAVMERLKHGPEHEMITMYHLDKDSILMTHYCEANNQPRMRASATGDAKNVAFSFVDAANLKSDQDGHMRKLVLTFIDQDHFNAEWTYHEKGKELPAVFKFARIK